MRVVVQRVSSASVAIEQSVRAEIGAGLLILLGVEHEDEASDADWLAAKIMQMRIFDDPSGAMNLSIQDIGGEVMIISQFTLYASTKKGNRPGFTRAARPETAKPMYEYFISKFQGAKHGEFGADMQISSCNNGPVTIIIDSKNRE